MPYQRPTNLMTTIEMWQEWNRLVPAAAALGHRRFRHIPRCWRLSRVDATRRLDSIRAAVGDFEVPAEQVTTEVGQQTFGVEFEFILPVGVSSYDLAVRLTEAGVPTQAEMYNHHLRSHWKIVTDGSLGDYANGRELVSPVLSGEAGMAAMRAACQVLTAAGCKVNKRCGLHVHVGARHRPVSFFKSLVRLYRHYEAAIETCLSASRRGRANMFCQPVTTTEMQLSQVRTVDDLRRVMHSRYTKLNLQSFWRHGTVEFRQHQGTVEARKAEMWVRLCLKMTALACAPVTMEGHSLASLLALLGADEEETTYFNQRAAHFARRDSRRMAA